MLLYELTSYYTCTRTLGASLVLQQPLYDTAVQQHFRLHADDLTCVASQLTIEASPVQA